MYNDGEGFVSLVVEFLEVVLNSFEVLKRIYEYDWIDLI